MYYVVKLKKGDNFSVINIEKTTDGTYQEVAEKVNKIEGQFGIKYFAEAHCSFKNRDITREQLNSILDTKLNQSNIMRSIRCKLELMLQERGMFESQSKEVLDLAIPKINKTLEDYKINLNDRCDAYPEVIYNILFQTIKETALEWIDNNKPMAWYRGMFV